MIWCLPVLLAGCGRPTVKVFAAASTRAVMDRVAADYRSKTGTAVECEFAASSTLARQIEHGAPADLFLSADEEWADYLEKLGLVAERRPLLTNRLVVVVPAESKLALRELADVAGPAVSRLAIAGPAVPAGRYARQALDKTGIRSQVEKRFLEGKDVTAVLLYVARDEADAGFIYVTDASANAKVRVACEVSEKLTGPIEYPLVRLSHSRSNPDAARFADYLAGAEAAAVFAKAGFGSAR